ncbi:MAG: transcription antitermination factor NusB [Scytolyngbya sp. HA4215-MV1]|jgi:N utilization substance protein B|nr:transcription antitermination factor NusB [Scytolyngbya sp. HA4215-MV1]
MQARRIARELALLSISQLPAKATRLEAQQLQDVILAAVRTLAAEVRDALESATAELQRSDAQLLISETRSSDLKSARIMVQDAISLMQSAINRLGIAVDLPEFIQLANQEEVHAYALDLLTTVSLHRAEIDAVLSQALVDWQLSRLARIDQDILRLAVAEINFMLLPDKVAINEAIELAKRYSGDDGHRFINGVLRRVTEQLKLQSEGKRD